MVNDVITSMISPSYFEIAKGIEGGDGFGGRVMALGFQAGFVAAALAASVCLYANNPREGLARLGYPVLSWVMLLPTVAAAVVGALAGALATVIEPLSILRGLDLLVPVPAAKPFVAVVGIHAGLYIGFVAGLVASIGWIRRKRRGQVGGVANQPTMVASALPFNSSLLTMAQRPEDNPR